MHRGRLPRQRSMTMPSPNASRLSRPNSSAITSLTSIENLRSAHAQSGAVFTNRARVIGLELFDTAKAFSSCFAKMVHAYAIDAGHESGDAEEGASPADVRRLLNDMIDVAMHKYEAIGDGEDIRLEGSVMAGGAHLDGDRIVRLAAYRHQGN